MRSAWVWTCPWPRKTTLHAILSFIVFTINWPICNLGAEQGQTEALHRRGKTGHKQGKASRLEGLLTPLGPRILPLCYRWGSLSAWSTWSNKLHCHVAIGFCLSLFLSVWRHIFHWCFLMQPQPWYCRHQLPNANICSLASEYTLYMSMMINDCDLEESITD